MYGEMIGHASGTLEQSMLAAANDVPNQASERLIKKLGFEPYSEIQGPKLRLRTYTLQRSAWAAARYR